MLSKARAPQQLQFQKHARAWAGVIFRARCRKKPKPASLHSAVETRGRAKEFRGRHSQHAVPATARDIRKKKKPGTAGLPDEFYFRSVHFASLAI